MQMNFSSGRNWVALTIGLMVFLLSPFIVSGDNKTPAELAFAQA